MAATTRGLAFFGIFALVGALATIIAAITGMVIVMVSVGVLSLIGVIFPTLLVSAFVKASMYAAPVTFGVLPLAALCLKGRPIIAQLSLPFVGAAGGAVTMWCWLKLTSNYQSGGSGSYMIIGAGLIGGLVAGAFYGRAMLELKS